MIDERSSGEFLRQLRSALVELNLQSLGEIIFSATAAALHIQSEASAEIVESVLGFKSEGTQVNADALFHATAQMVVSSLFGPVQAQPKQGYLDLQPLVSAYGQNADWIDFCANYFKDAMYMLQISKRQQYTPSNEFHEYNYFKYQN